MEQAGSQRTSDHRVDAGRGDRRLALESVHADPSVLTAVRHRIDGFAREIGWPPDTTTDVLLATYEALANVVEHAYPADERGTFDLLATYHHADGTLSVVIVDRGTWLPQSDDNSARRGQGLRLMRALCESVRVEPRDGGTEIELQWKSGNHRPLPLPGREQQVDP
ncbi:Anti sigma factor [Rhodococcus sp. RD6.2]|jgi:serine/threonine-protein kinase RsbW|nr:Anti sigma factor [Rhodococcus sp. RD6.2]